MFRQKFQRLLQQALARLHLEPSGCARTESLLIHADLLEPAEQSLSRGPRERLSQLSFMWPRCLADEIYFRQHRPRRDYGSDHVRTLMAGFHFGKMRFEGVL